MLLNYVTIHSRLLTINQLQKLKCGRPMDMFCIATIKQMMDKVRKMCPATARPFLRNKLFQLTCNQHDLTQGNHIYPFLKPINIKENRRGNLEQKIQRHWTHINTGQRKTKPQKCNTTQKTRDEQHGPYQKPSGIRCKG